MRFFKKFRYLNIFFLSLTGSVLAFLPARADESPFGYVYTSEVLPPGAMEIEQWGTWAWNKPEEDFSQFKGRTEFEYGITNRFQIAAYLNYADSKIVPRGAGAPDDASDEFEFESVSFEGIYQVLSPYLDPVGLAFYVEPAIGKDERELEFKALLQKNFLEDRLILAANLILEYEWEREHGDWEHESAFEISLGASYRFAPGWFAGAEFLNENGYEGHILGGAKAETNAYFAGPTLHYAAEKWWATASLLAQLPWAGNPAGDPGAVTDDYLTGKERWRFRMRIGIPL